MPEFFISYGFSILCFELVTITLIVDAEGMNDVCF